MTTHANRWLRAIQVGCLAIVATVGGAALAEDPPEMAPEMRADIERLMEVTKAYDPALVEQMSGALAQQIAGMISDKMKPEVFARCMEISNKAFAEMMADGGFQEELNAIYARHFSHDDIRELLAFYETPLGKKTIEVMPQLMMESMQVTMGWVAKVNPVIQERVTAQLREEGLIE